MFFYVPNNLQLGFWAGHINCEVYFAFLNMSNINQITNKWPSDKKWKIIQTKECNISHLTDLRKCWGDGFISKYSMQMWRSKFGCPCKSWAWWEVPATPAPTSESCQVKRTKNMSHDVIYMWNLSLSHTHRWRLKQRAFPRGWKIRHLVSRYKAENINIRNKLK